MEIHRHEKPTERRLAWLAVIWCCSLLLPSCQFDREPKLPKTLAGHTDHVWSVAFSPDGKTLASGGADETIRFWDVATGKEQAALNEDKLWVDSVAFSPDGKTLASGSGGKIKLWDVGTLKDTALFNKRSQYASSLVVFSPDGKTLASGGRCIQEIRLWEVATGKQLATLEGHDEYGVCAMAFSPDGKVLTSVGDNDGALKQWDVAAGKNTATRKLADSINAAAFTPDGKTLAAVCVVEKPVRNESTKLWDLETGAQAPIEGPTASGWHIALSPNGKMLAMELGNAIKLWDVATGRELATLQGHTDEIHCLAFSADGTMLATGSKDKTIKLWDVARAK